MKLFTTDINKTKLSEKAAAGIANGILIMQSWFAVTMRRLTKNWQQQQRWIFFYLVCLVFGGLSIIVIVHPFQSTVINSLPLPKFISKSSHYDSESKGFLITKEELQKVQQYKAGHPNLAKEMPHLYDSLNLIEQAYYSQQK